MKVSIITVCRNSAATIEQTIQSVIEQSYTNLEFIIIDGGSSDQTLSIVNKYQHKITKVISEKDNGIFDAMNKGINLATGEIIGILNSDDVYADRGVVEKVVTEMEKSNADVSWGDLVYVKKNDPSKVTRVWKSSPYMTGLFKKGWQAPHPTFFVRKTVYQRYGMFNTNLPISADYEILLRFLERYKVTSIYIPATLVKMREGGNSNWKNLFRVFQANLEVKRAWQMNNLTMPRFTILNKLFSKIKQTF